MESEILLLCAQGTDSCSCPDPDEWSSRFPILLLFKFHSSFVLPSVFIFVLIFGEQYNVFPFLFRQMRGTKSYHLIL